MDQGREQIPELLAGLAGETAHVRLIAEVRLATGARWGEAEGLVLRQVRHGLIRYSKTRSSKNRSVPIAGELQQNGVKWKALRSKWLTRNRTGLAHERE